jgi:hypothetical protein
VEPGGGRSALATVTLRGQTGGLRRDLIADRDGKYRASDLPADSYVVTARSVHGGASATVAAVVREGQTVDVPIQLSAGWSTIQMTGLREAQLYGGTELDALARGAEITRGQEGGNLEGYGPTGFEATLVSTASASAARTITFWSTAWTIMTPGCAARRSNHPSRPSSP